jgi:hypothetical protein
VEASRHFYIAGDQFGFSTFDSLPLDLSGWKNPGCITGLRASLYKSLIIPHDIPYEKCPPIEIWRCRQLEDPMSTFRTLRPLLVDATQCEHPETIATQTGFRSASKGDWIVNGENGETYVVDNAFFQRTFTPLQTSSWKPKTEEGRNYGC